MEKRFISVDIETSGPTAPPYTMLSLGACVVGDTQQQFYAEMKPISAEYLFGAMKIGCLGLHCLRDKTCCMAYNPQSAAFNPSKVLELLHERGEEPSTVMRNFVHWALEATKGYTPVLAAYPTPFDIGMVNMYIENFTDGAFPTKNGELMKNPFGHIARDIGDMCRGHFNNDDAKLEWLGVRERRRVVHNALEDAVQQALVMEELQRRMERRRNKESKSVIILQLKKPTF